VLTRTCGKCRHPRPLRDFEALGEPCETCRNSTPPESRSERAAKIAELQRRRRSLIAALVKIDAEIATLKGRPPASQPFERVERSDVFEGETSDPGDIGFGE
jgi:hypothetical protein